MATTYDNSAYSDDGRASLTKDGGLLLSGSAKLAQRFLIELLTEQGSLTFLPLRGTRMPTRLRARNLTDFDILAAFAASELEAKNNLVAEDALYPDSPDDEKYLRARANSIVLSQTGAVIVIQVFSVAGSTTTVQLPINAANSFTEIGID
jgi:hypothetical protein